MSQKESLIGATLSFLLVFICSSASAQDMSFMNPASTDRTALSLEEEHFSAPNSRPDLTVEEQRASFSIPVYKGLSSGLAFIGHGKRTQLGEKLRFQNSGIEIPDEFGTADLGFSWSREDLLKNKIGFSATYGNAGTRLFSGESDPLLSANLIIERKNSDRSWIYFLSYSNNRTTLNNIPIPGVAYVMRGETYNAVFGLPFIFVMWRPSPFSLTTALSPFGASVDLGFHVWGPVLLYGMTNWSPRAYQNLVEHSDDRLIFDKKEGGGGLRIILGSLGTLSAGYVYSFDRRFILGESITDQNESFDIGDVQGFQLKLRLAF